MFSCDEKTPQQMKLNPNSFQSANKEVNVEIKVEQADINDELVDELPKKTVICTEDEFIRDFDGVVKSEIDLGDYKFGDEIKSDEQNQRLNAAETSQKNEKQNKCLVNITTKVDYLSNRFKLQTKVSIGKRKYECYLCNHISTRSDHLKLHMITHTGERKFKCSGCKKRFTNSTGLSRHMLIHNKVLSKRKPYRCTQHDCGKRFSQKSDLNRHSLSHTGEKRFECAECGEQFSLKCNLNPHMRTHTSEKPFRCKLCPKRFTQKISLIHHMRTHTKEKPFLCERCSKSFSRKSSLNIHLKRCRS